MKNLKIKNMTDTSANLYLYGDIVDDGWKWFESDITPQDVLDQLEQLKGKTLNIYINSGGGDVFAGTAINNMLRRHDGKTIGHVDGVAASIASVILMACDEVVVPANAYVMIHRPECKAEGNVDDLMKACEVLDTIEEGIFTTYLAHSDMDKETLGQMMKDETWMTGDQFAEHFTKSVTVVDPVKAVACATALSHKRWPKAIVDKANEDDVKKMALEVALAIS
ncbi:MAG: Clp protease ClpP [Peptococcaceae bacterium]|nr:Clp protease ClpP [Peptococcaceae bacterium]